MSAFEAGKPNAGAALYDRLFPVVDSAIFRILGRREHDHADLVQCAFEQIVKTLAKRRYERNCSLVGWASVIACHVGLNALRSRRRERGVVDRDLPFGAPGVPERATGQDPEAELSMREELAAVRRHLAEIDPDRVMALLLSAMGHDLNEIARLTKTSVAAAQSRLSRGRRELWTRLHHEQTRESFTPYARSRP